MLESLNRLMQSPSTLQRELSRYELSGITNLAALSRIKKAYLKASKKIETEQDLLDCKTTFYGSLQKMKRLGIDINDIDLWFINVYGNSIKAEYMYPALLRSAARRGFPCFPIFEFILKEEEFSTRRAENNRILIDYCDKGLAKNITIETLHDFRIFFLLLDIRHEGRLIHQEKVQMTSDEILKHKEMSKNKDKGAEVKKWNNSTKSYEMVEKEDESVWQHWTKQMIQKTLILQAFSMVKHTIPDLGEIFEFEDLDNEDFTMTEPAEEKPFIPETNNIDAPSKEVLAESKKLKEEYEITPELVDFNKNRVLQGITICKTVEEAETLISLEAATILSLGEEFKQQVKNERKTISKI